MHKHDNTVVMKHCTNKLCKEINPQDLNNFYKRGLKGFHSTCIACKKLDGKKYALLNRDKRAATSKAWTENNRENKNANTKRWQIENPEKLKTSQKAYREHNLGKIYSKNAKRYADKLQRTPKWLTNSQKQEIDNLYILANELSDHLSETLHVDHIVPLIGKDVSGLHVPWNLQIIPASENFKKGNRIGADFA